ncbi:EAL domain-containing protein [Roseibium algae]|uniref:EAL domain-containing protein n=1 Tax=Roseibium algae TaxID=3123038 RepID=A0ABU8TP12_9HYPH
MKEGHIEKVRALVESGKSIAEDNYGLYKSGKLSEKAAHDKARDAIRSMKFNGGARVFAFDENGIRVVSNRLYFEGTSAWEAPQTQSMIRKAINGGGVTYYVGAREFEGNVTSNVPKAAWSEHFAPWGWIIASAVYLDDVTIASWDYLIELTMFLGLGGMLVLMIANSITRNITDPLDALTDNMKELASGNTQLTITGAGRGDEIGEMATAMQTFVANETQRLAMHAQLKSMVYKDSLTGLSNRASFYQALHEDLQNDQPTNRIYALMILDLDRFKSINDTLGHLAGDHILREFSKRLKKVIGKHGKIGRLSGDEFFVILPNIRNTDQADEIASEIHAEARRAISVEGTQVNITTSIGLAFWQDNTVSDSKLYGNADMALYAAKEAGGGCSAHYLPEMGAKAEKVFELETMIKEGLLAKQFTAYFQAKVELSTGKITGAEALCRWIHPEKGIISPAEFIPIAEKTGHILEIGDMMMKQACQFAVECNKVSKEPFVVAVNVSAKQLVYGRMLTTLGKCLQETGCRASWLELEITESLLLSETDDMVELLERIANLGILITIDDFGTGYSAMSYLSRFPIKCLKIDQSFIRDMCSDGQKRVLVTAILAMANGLGLKTVAEGVEDEQVSAELANLKCDFGQGYLWHRPSCPEELLSQIKLTEAA